MATPQHFVFALFVAVLMSCTHKSFGARPVPGDRETERLDPLVGIPLSASIVSQSTPEIRWLPVWVNVLPKNLQSLRGMIPVSAPASTPSAPPQLASSSAQPMFMGIPGFGFPGMGLPGMGLPGMGLPGMGIPGMGFPGPIIPPV